MTQKTILDYRTLETRARRVADEILSSLTGHEVPVLFYGVPRGGVPALYLVLQHLSGVPYEVTDNLAIAEIIIDDLIDSGSTMERVTFENSTADFYGLFDKRTEEDADLGWIVFPWESAEDAGFEDNVRRMLQAIDPNADREGLIETPVRVAKAWTKWAEGYGQDPAGILKVFEDGAGNYDEMVTVANIPVYSKCEHHMADIFGTATVSYIPNGKIVGLSKLSRLVNIYARRLQVQERLTVQIADALQEHLAPLGVGVQLKCRHMCMESRGVCQQGHHTVTTALRGVMKEGDPRAEFLAVAG